MGPLFFWAIGFCLVASELGLSPPRGVKGLDVRSLKAESIKPKAQSVDRCSRRSGDRHLRQLTLFDFGEYDKCLPQTGNKFQEGCQRASGGDVHGQAEVGTI